MTGLFTKILLLLQCDIRLIILDFFRNNFNNGDENIGNFTFTVNNIRVVT